MCPVCSSSATNQQTTGSLISDDFPLQLIAYRCENGHVFVVQREKQSAGDEN